MQGQDSEVQRGVKPQRNRSHRLAFKKKKCLLPGTLKNIPESHKPGRPKAAAPRQLLKVFVPSPAHQEAVS